MIEDSLNEAPDNQLTPIELATPVKNEYEVWATQEDLPPSLLVVIVGDGEKPLKIINPATANCEVFSSNHYLDIVVYLRQGDYTRVKGRMKIKSDDDDDDD